MDVADEADREVQVQQTARLRAVPSGIAPCCCAVLSIDEGETLTECELARREDREAPEHCRRRCRMAGGGAHA